MNHLLFFINSAALGVGLAMDAFSVSIANGLREPQMKPRRMTAIAGVYAFFQFLMPMLGWLLVRMAVGAFHAFRPFIPYIALLLLVWIGGNMLWEGIRQTPGQNAAARGELLEQGLATSIDALSVGFTIVEYQALSALLASLIIAVVTFVICCFGLRIGRAFGTQLAHRASIIGGVILIGIGLEIFLRGVL